MAELVAERTAAPDAQCYRRGEDGDLIWQGRRRAGGEGETGSEDVPVHRAVLAVILQLAERTLAQCPPADMTAARHAVEQVKTALADRAVAGGVHGTGHGGSKAALRRTKMSPDLGPEDAKR